MKFIYKLDCVMPSMSVSGDGVDMDYEDLVSSMDLDNEGPSLNSLVERSKLMEGLMMQLSTCPTYQHDITGSSSGVSKTVDTDEVTSTNGHYTLEDFFSGYGEVNRNESIDDVSETDLDFSKLFGNFDDFKEENPFQSLIDLVKCEIPEDLSVVDDRFPKEVKMEEEPPVVLSPQTSQCRLVPKPELVQTRSKKNIKTTKKPKTPAPKPEAIVGTRLVEKKEYVNSRKIDYGANDTAENIYDLQWHPGFTRHLGAKGRSALLELVRRVYRQDPEHYKAILQSKNSSSSISNLPFYSIPMLWELAHQFGIFKQALTVYKTHCFSKSRSNRFYGFGKNSQTSVSSDSSDNPDSDRLEKRDSPDRIDSPKLPLTTMSGRLVKRSKKILEYNPDSPLDNLDSFVKLNSKSQSTVNDPLDQSLSQLSLNNSVKDESSNSLIGSPNRLSTKFVSSQTDSDTSIMWKLAVSNRSSNCVDQFKDESMTSGHKLNRRISV